MEELIWKYIDNDCTEAEVQHIKHLLATDPSFESMYQEMLQLDHIFKTQKHLVMSEGFKVSLVNNIEKQVAILPKQTEIIPAKWWILAAIVAISVVTFATQLPNQNSLLIDINIPLDGRTMAIATWSMVGFVFLNLLDYLLKNKSIFRKQTYFLT
jgi:hypothetical protein